ncbi:MAG: ATP-binding protein [bacterium]
MVTRPPRRRMRFGIQERLVLWLLAFGVLPVAGTSILGYWLMSRTAVRAAGNRLTAVAERLAGSVDSELRGLVHDIGGADPGFTALAPRLTVRAGPDPDDSAALAAALAHPIVPELERIRRRAPTRYEQVAVADARGVVIASTHPVTRLAAAGEDWWRLAWNRGQGASYLGRLLRDADSPAPSITIALPVRDRAGRTVGVLRVVANLAGLAEAFEDVTIGATGIATMTSGFGDLLLSSAYATDRVPAVSATRRQRLATSRPTWYSGRGLLGRASVIAFAPVRATAGQSSFGGTNWVVTVEQDRAEVLAPTIQFSNLATGIGLLIAAGVIVVGLFLSERIARPLLDLRNGARRIGAGELDLRLDVATGDEIEDLAGEFNAMAARLGESRRGLEDRVRAATAELAREHGALQAIVAALGEGLMVISPERRIVMWNRAAEQLTGFPAAEVIGRPCSEVLRARDDSTESLCQDRCPARTALERGRAVKSIDLSTTIARKDGHRLPVTVSAAPVVDRDGRDQGCVVVLHDVTREREIDRLKSEMVSTVSHELRSPLNSVIGFADLLDTPGLPAEKRRQYTRFIVSEGRRLERMVDDFLTLSRIEAGRFELAFKNVDLRELVDGLFAVEAGANPRHLLSCDIPPGFPAVRADRERIRRALHNLITNAIKYSPDGGPVTVSAEARDGWFEISVRDRGIGIRKEDLDKLFHRFQRVGRQDRPDIPGTGLGLAITAGIVREHGGEVRVESEHGQGSVFTIRLPANRPAA